MTPTQAVALTRAKAFLAATGLPYAIKLPDGTIEGILVVAPEKKTITRKRINDFVGTTQYPEILDVLQPGASHVFTADNEVQAEKLRSTISSSGIYRWGRGNVITAVTGTHVEILRIA